MRPPSRLRRSGRMVAPESGGVAPVGSSRSTKATAATSTKSNVSSLSPIAASTPGRNRFDFLGAPPDPDGAGARGEYRPGGSRAVLVVMASAIIAAARGPLCPGPGRRARRRPRATGRPEPRPGSRRARSGARGRRLERHPQRRRAARRVRRGRSLHHTDRSHRHTGGGHGSRTAEGVVRPTRAEPRDSPGAKARASGPGLVGPGLARPPRCCQPRLTSLSA